MYTIPAASLVREYSFIVASDPALEDNPEAHRLYAERGDESHLKLKPGEQPTRWMLRHVTGRANKYLFGLAADANGDSSKWGIACWSACQHGLIGANNLVTAAGGDFVFTKVRCPDTKAMILSEDTLSQIDAIPPMSLIYEIGGYVLSRLHLPPL